MNAPSDVAHWLETRTPAPPPVLAGRLRALLGRAGSRPASEAADAMLDCGAELLRGLLGDGCLDRTGALDLLAADALVTYAFEAASEEPGTLDARACDAMVRIAAVAHRAAERA